MKRFRAKTFKSGNSIALRLPKSAGFEEGDEMMVVPHSNGSYSMFKVDDRLDVFMALPGQFSAGFMSEARGDIEQPDCDWSPRDDATEAA